VTELTRKVTLIGKSRSSQNHRLSQAYEGTSSLCHSEGTRLIVREAKIFRTPENVYKLMIVFLRISNAGEPEKSLLCLDNREIGHVLKA